jgi:hypothetical protein
VSSSKSRLGSTEPCVCGCGRLQGTQRRHGLRNGCYARWIRQGKPEHGPSAPLTPDECAARRRASMAARALLAEDCRDADPGETDPYDIEWAAGESERRIRRAWPQAVALTQCMLAGDQKGVRELRHRITDWPAVAWVAAERVRMAAPAVLTLVAGDAARRPLRAASDGEEAEDAA